jgi:hypothetical protein
LRSIINILLFIQEKAAETAEQKEGRIRGKTISPRKIRNKQE